MAKQQRLQRKIEDLNQQWELLTDKINRLRNNEILTADTNQKIALGAQRTEAEHDRKLIEQQLNDEENELKKEGEYSQLYSSDNSKQLVFINVDNNDIALCDAICNLLDEKNKIDYMVVKIEHQKPSNLRKAFEDGVQDCYALMIIYGQADFDWLHQIVKDVRKIASLKRAESPFPAYVICDPSPEQKHIPLYKCKFQGISKFQYASYSNKQQLYEIINSLVNQEIAL